MVHPIQHNDIERSLRFQSVARTPIAFVRVGDFCIMDCNRHFLEMMQYDECDVIGKLALSFVNYKSINDVMKRAKCLERYPSRVERIRSPWLIQLNTKHNQCYAEMWGKLVQWDDYTLCWAIQLYPVDHLIRMNESLLNAKYSTESYQNHLEHLVEERTKQLRKSQERMTKIEKMAVIGKTAAVVAHELRNPLGIVRNGLYSLKNAWEKDDDKKADEITDRMTRAIKRCDGIIEMILNYTRTTGVKTYEMNFDQFIELVVADFDFPKHIRVEKDLNTDLVVKFGKEKIHSGIVNIFQNAVDAIPHDGEEYFIRIETWVEDDQVYIDITNSGSTIRDDELDDIFDLLYSTKAIGSGLGLPTTKKFFEEHNGDVIALNSDNTVTFRCHLGLKPGLSDSTDEAA